MQCSHSDIQQLLWLLASVNFFPFPSPLASPPSASSLRPYGVLHSEHQPLMNMPFIAVHSQSLREARLTLQLVYFIS